MLRFLSSGESHGKCLIAVLEGMVAGLTLKEEEINSELARRQEGYGRGGRMTIAFRPDGPRPGRGTWGSYSTSWAMRDARATAPGYNATNATALTPAAREAAIAAFGRAEARDRTNPFLPEARDG